MAPEPTPHNETPPEIGPRSTRPELRLVPRGDQAASTPDPPPADAADVAEDLDETSTPTEPAAEIVVDAPAAVESADPVIDERAVTPQAPLDQRLLKALGDVLAARPQWDQQPPSWAQIWDYSTNGDWTTEANSARRIGHSLIVLIGFAVLFLPDWAVQVAKQKPIGFVLTAAVVALLLIAL